MSAAVVAVAVSAVLVFWASFTAGSVGLVPVLNEDGEPNWPVVVAGVAQHALAATLAILIFGALS